MAQYSNSLETLPEDYPIFDFPNVNNKYIQRHDFLQLNNEKENSENIILKKTLSREYYNNFKESTPLAEKDINYANGEQSIMISNTKMLQMNEPIFMKPDKRLLSESRPNQLSKNISSQSGSSIKLCDNTVNSRTISSRKKSINKGFNDSKFNDLNAILDSSHQNSVIKHPTTSSLSGTTKVSSAGDQQQQKPQWMEHLKRIQMNEDLGKNWNNDDLIKDDISNSVKDSKLEVLSDSKNDIQIDNQNSDYSNSANTNKNHVLKNSVSSYLNINKNGQQSPLKIFNEDYNTYTKDKLNKLLSKGIETHSTSGKEEFLSEEFHSSQDEEPEITYSIFRQGKSQISKLERSSNMSEDGLPVYKANMNQSKNSKRFMSRSGSTKSLERTDDQYKEYADQVYQQALHNAMSKSTLYNSQSATARNINNMNITDIDYSSSEVSYTDASVMYETDREAEPTSFSENRDTIPNKNLKTTSSTSHRDQFKKLKVVDQPKIFERKVYPNGSVKFLVKDDIDEYKSSHGMTDEALLYERKSISKFDKEEANASYEYDINESFMKDLHDGKKIQPSILKKNRVDHNKANHQKLASIQEKNTSKVYFNQYLRFGEGDVNIPKKVKGMVYDIKEKKWNRDSLQRSSDNDSVDALNAIANLSVENSLNSSRGEISSDGSNDITFNHLPNVSSISQMDITFSESKKALMNVLTDVIVKNKHWDVITDLDLSGREIMNLIGLDSSVPNVCSLVLDKNNLRIFDGIPLTVDKISAQSNQLGEIVSLRKYRDLEYLDLTDNFIQNLRTFKNLAHLRCLKLNSNVIQNLSGLSNVSFHNLATLDLSNNYIRGNINFKHFKSLSNLQELDLSDNFIESIDSLKYLENLISLKVDNNELTTFNFDQGEGNENIIHKQLRKLSLKNNKLESLDVGFFRRLRVLRVNDNIHLLNLDKICKLDELLLNGSFSNENEHTLKNEKILQGTYNILNRIVEYNTVKILNVTNTGITNLSISRYLGLETLYSLFNNIENFQVLIEDIKYLTNLKKIDFRYNPITQGFYSASSKKDLVNIYYGKLIKKQDESVEELYLECDDDLTEFRVGKSGVSESIFSKKFQQDWMAEDEKYVESLKVNNINLYKKRVYYHGLLIKLFKKIRYIDGICITPERRERILEEFNKIVL